MTTIQRAGARRIRSIGACGAALLCAALLAAAAFFTGSAHAQTSFGSGFGHDASEPIEVAAESLEVRNSDNVAVFRGQVRVKQGAVRMTATELEVTYARGGGEGAIDRLKAIGEVVITNGNDTATADEADYDVGASEILMTGDVLLVQGSNAIAGDKLRIDLTTGQARMIGRVVVKVLPDAQ